MRKLVALLLVAVALLAVPRARAAFTMALTQTANDVQLTGSGTLNLTGLTFYSVAAVPGEIAAASGTLIGGGRYSTGSFLYSGITGPASFGIGGMMTADNISGGDPVGIVYGSLVSVPDSYTSGAPLATNSTYGGANFISLDSVLHF